MSLNPSDKFSIRPLSRPIIGFDDTRIVWIGCLCNTAILMGVFYPNMFFSGPYDRYLALWAGVLAFVAIHWYGMRWLYLEVVKRYPGYNNRRHRIVRLPLVVSLYFACLLYTSDAADD